MTLVFVLLRWLCFILGLAGLVGPFLLYESEERHLRNRLVDWWVSVTTTGELIVAKHITATRAVAERALQAIDMFFGRKPVSVRLIWTSAMLSGVGFLSTVLMLRQSLLWLNVHWPEGAKRVFVFYESLGPFVQGRDAHMGALRAAFEFATLAIVPALIRRPLGSVRNIYALVALVACGHALIGYSNLLRAVVWMSFGMIHSSYLAVCCVVFSLVPIGCDIAVLWATRIVLRKAISARGPGICLLGILVLLPVVLVFGSICLGSLLLHGRGYQIPVAWNFGAVEWVDSISAMAGVALWCAIPMNMVDILVGLSLGLLALVLALNFLFWPTIARLLNALYSRRLTRTQMVAFGTFFLSVFATSFTSVVRRILGVP